jgi:hypothetical protein
MTTGLDLLAEGNSIVLTDGTTVNLRYAFRSLALLEARFGSVAGIQAAINASGESAAFGPIAQIIGAGAVGPGGYEPHIREYQDAKGARHVQDIVYRRRGDGVDLADLLDPGRLGEYSAAFTAALSKALESRSASVPPAGAPVVTVTPGLDSPSPGTTSSTSPSVPSTFLPIASGT